VAFVLSVAGGLWVIQAARQPVAPIVLPATPIPHEPEQAKSDPARPEPEPPEPVKPPAHAAAERPRTSAKDRRSEAAQCKIRITHLRGLAEDPKLGYRGRQLSEYLTDVEATIRGGDGSGCTMLLSRDRIKEIGINE
jgi:hypothetical protein